MTNYNPMIKTLEEPEFAVLDQTVDTDLYSLFVFNDEINTFDHVIDTLMDVCGHTPEQAEQCTLIIHYKGRAAVKNGSFEELAPMRNDICRRGISAEII